VREGQRTPRLIDEEELEREVDPRRALAEPRTRHHLLERGQFFEQPNPEAHAFF